MAATSGRSDDAPFYRKNVPALHFCTGTHKDYHKPSDDSEKIDADGAAQVVGLVGAVARELANVKAPPQYVAGLRAKTIVSGSSSVYRVVMGLTPGYGDDGLPGMIQAIVREKFLALAAGIALLMVLAGLILWLGLWRSEPQSRIGSAPAILVQSPA